ncbi:MAG TPA: hypothetical protein PLV68_21740 [Ilumatobacteraceae bacterium]|nr:hypothetical protein [Ilumatobacteraceae bacterium]
MVSFLVFAGLIGLCVAMLYAAQRVDPHWVSKDGQRMICQGQGLARDGTPVTRWRELKVAEVGDGRVEVRTRHGSLTATQPTRQDYSPTAALRRPLFREPRQKTSMWRVQGIAADAPKRKVIYVLDGNDDPGMPALVTLRMPANSKAIPMLDRLLATRVGRIERATPDSTDTA